jgi:hypothetical protein
MRSGGSEQDSEALTGIAVHVVNGPEPVICFGTVRRSDGRDEPGHDGLGLGHDGLGLGHDGFGPGHDDRASPAMTV